MWFQRERKWVQCASALSSATGFAGTPGYLSPEVLRKDPYGKPVDIWACGKPIPHSQLFGVKGPQLPAMVRNRHRYSLWAPQVSGVCEITVFALVPLGGLFSSHAPPQVFPGLYCILPKEGFTHTLEDGLCRKKSPVWLADMGSEA